MTSYLDAIHAQSLISSLIGETTSIVYETISIIKQVVLLNEAISTI